MAEKKEEMMEEVLEDLEKDAAEKQAEEVSEAEETETETEAAESGEQAEETEESEAEDGQEAPADEKKGFFKKKKDKKDEQIEELNDKLKRQMAEFDNFRKRTEKEKTQMYDMGAKSIIEKTILREDWQQYRRSSEKMRLSSGWIKYTDRCLPSLMQAE